MQNPSPQTNYPPSYGGGSSGGSGGSGNSGGDAAEASDLPPSLPSYMPQQQQQQQHHHAPPPHQQQQQQPTLLPFAGGGAYDLQAQFAASVGDAMHNSNKRQAPLGQWKTPPQFLYPAAVSGGAGATTANTMIGSGAGRVKTNAASRHHRDVSQPSPSTGLRSMSFQDSTYGGGGGNSSSGDEKKPPPPQEIGGISAAQFAASTGGLTMDATLLARVSGMDPALMGSEEIKQIMRTPDLLSIYQKLQEEDDRRQRRLERNRASARVRREKKKNMVDMYEGEVSKLENALNLLKSHAFGRGQPNELLSALDYTGGEHLRHAMMSKDSKTELLGRILGQHTRNTSAIRCANMENQILVAAASENSELFTTLRTQLRLSDEQCRQLQSLAHHTRDEGRKLDAIAKCFSALRAHDWLYFPGMESLLHHTRNTMTQQQFQKFMTWTGDNREVIEQLQVIQPAHASAEQDIEFFFAED